jgi:ABC-type multidrug transport system fused ATPase/permease subunit
VLDTEADLKDGTRSFPAEGARGDIALRHVSFRYRPETPVLNGSSSACRLAPRLP